MRSRLVLVAGLLASLGVLHCGSSSSSSSPAPSMGDGDAGANAPQGPPELHGEYVSIDAGAISRVSFVDASTYWSIPTACTGTFASCVARGTYVLATDASSVTLTDATTGQAMTLPLQIGFAGTSTHPDSLHLLDLVSSDAGPLITTTGALVSSFTMAGQTFNHAIPTATVTYDSVDGQYYQDFVGLPGNEILVNYHPAGGRSGTCATGKPSIDWTYADSAGTFAGATSLTLTYAATVGSGAPISATVTLPLDAMASGSSGNIYDLTTCPDFAGAASIALLDFSFSSAAKSDANDGAGYTLSFVQPEADPAGHLTTSVGNPVSAEVVLVPGSNANCASPVLELSYTDKKGFFSGSSAIYLWVQFNEAGGAHQSTTVTMTGSNGSYSTSRFCLGSAEAAASSLAIAFGNTAKTRWDSNDSKNYTLTLQ